MSVSRRSIVPKQKELEWKCRDLVLDNPLTASEANYFSQAMYDLRIQDPSVLVLYASTKRKQNVCFCKKCEKKEEKIEEVVVQMSYTSVYSSYIEVSFQENDDQSALSPFYGDYTTETAMIPYARSHLNIAFRLAASLSKHYNYYIPGDGLGAFSLAFKHRNLNYYSTEPNAIGEKARKFSVITSSDRYDPMFFCDVAVFVNVADDFQVSDFHFARKFIVWQDNSRVPDRFFPYVVPRTRGRLFSNVITSLAGFDFSNSVYSRLLKFVTRDKKYVSIDFKHFILLTGMSYDVLFIPDETKLVQYKDRVVIGPGYWNLLSGQNKFFPVNNFILGKRGDCFFSAGRLYKFSLPRVLVASDRHVFYVDCATRKETVHKIFPYRGLLYVRLCRLRRVIWGYVLGVKPKKIGKYLVRSTVFGQDDCHFLYEVEPQTYDYLAFQKRNKDKAVLVKPIDQLLFA